VLVVLAVHLLVWCENGLVKLGTAEMVRRMTPSVRAANGAAVLRAASASLQEEKRKKKKKERKKE